VNDGSRDRTQIVLNELVAFNPVQLLTNELFKNVGKAEAIRETFIYLIKNNIEFDYVGYLDADLSTPLSEMKRLYSIANEEQLLMVFGSRVKLLGNSITRSLKRHYLGRIFATLASKLIGLPIYDTQCGAKVFHNSIINELFNKPFVSKWIFDIELFIRYKKNYDLKYIKEITLESWTEIGGSKIKLKDFVRIPVEFFRIWRKGK
jgi:glycosyltransferase involved in cell wall biosynthesis